MKAVVEPKENGSIDEEEEKVSSVADAVQSAEKAFEMADATPAVETSSPKAVQAMMCVLFPFSLISRSCFIQRERERESARARAYFWCFFH